MPLTLVEQGPPAEAPVNTRATVMLATQQIDAHRFADDSRAFADDSRAFADDSRAFAVDSRALAEDLRADRFEVQAAPTGAELLTAIADVNPDVLVIDGRHGLAPAIEVVTRLRDGGSRRGWDPGLPVLVLCAGDEAHAAIRALERGADDAMCDPFSYAELVARIAALMRRSRIGSFAEIHVGPLQVCGDERRALLHGERVVLCGKEFALLSALAREPRRVLSKEELMLRVWGYRSAVRTRTIDTHASRLRRKLAAIDPGLGFVANVWGVGYRLLPLDA